ncbi:MAG: hypothetical protein V1779_10165 [bacterium]
MVEYKADGRQQTADVNQLLITNYELRMKNLIFVSRQSSVGGFFLVFIIGLFFTATILFANDDDLSGGVLDKNVNSEHEDYGAYVIYGTEMDTLFFTSSRPVDKKRKIAVTAEMFFSTRPANQRHTKQINEGWSKAKQIVAEASKIAEFTRGSIALNASKSKIIFAAERDLTNSKAQGSSYLFDLYEMYKDLKGFSQPKPLSEVNEPDYWDSQPALSPDGKILFFVSNRDGGSGGLDIWYSVTDYKGMWSKPQVVPNINTAGDEYSPHCGSDGYFYFSTNWDYKNNAKGRTGRDIYRADYSKSQGITLPVNPISLDEAIANDAEKYGLELPGSIKYNSDKDDEFPYISEDRKAIFITSNRKEDFDKRNIFAYSLPKSRIRLQVNVSEKILDANGFIVRDATPKVGLNLTLVDRETGVTKDITSGAPYEVDVDKEYFIQFSKFVEEECYTNRIEGPDNLTIKTVQPFGRDTLFIENVLIVRQKVEIPPVVFNSTDTLPYFITGYWYPNTTENLREYRDRESKGFFNRTGFVDSTGYDYHRITQQIDNNFKKKIYEPLEELLPAFQDFCRDTLYLKVTIHGYTDPRGLSGGEEHPYRPESKYQRIYPDETITVGVDERGQEVRIPSGINMWNYNWPVNPDDKEGKWIKLPNEGEKGNILLSKLRAYFTFVTFDRKMTELSPIYEQVRNNGRVILDAEGFGIDKEGFKARNLRDDPQSRRIEIYLDILRPEELAYHKRLPGGQLKMIPITIKESTPVESVPKDKDKIETVEETTKSVPETTPELKEILEEDTKSEPSPVFETEDEYTDEDEIAEKYGDVKSVHITQPLPPAKDDPRIQKAEAERFCYKIYYQAYTDFEEALKAKQILSAAGIEDVRVVEIIDNFGSNRTYELYSGCYSETTQAINAMKQVSWATDALKLSRNPVIIK